MFDTICSLVPQDQDYPARVRSWTYCGVCWMARCMMLCPMRFRTSVVRGRVYSIAAAAAECALSAGADCGG
jgi:hypothetical protein